MSLPIISQKQEKKAVANVILIQNKNYECYLSLIPEQSLTATQIAKNISFSEEVELVFKL
jgi:hypothetical protein